MKKVKVLFFIPVFDTGGTEKIVFDLLSHLDAGCYKKHLCTFFPGEYDRLIKHFDIQRHTLVKDIGNSKKFFPIKIYNFVCRLISLNKIINDHSINIIHTHHMGPLVHIFCLLKTKSVRIPWIHTEHNIPNLIDFHNTFPLGHFALKMLRAPDFITGVSEKLCFHLKNEYHINDKKLVFIPNGVDVDFFADRNNRDKTRKEIGLVTEDEVIGCIGNLRREKNHRFLLEAFAALKKIRPRAKIVLCGDGECRSELQDMAYQLNIRNDIFFLGYRFDIPSILSTFDVFCLPSKYEGMPLSIFEAWASGTPVIATDVVGIRDLVAHGQDGFLVPVDDANRLAEGIIELLANSELKQKIVESGRQRVYQKYSLSSMVKSYSDLYERALVK
jgi:glycosyltransferase involved in cell wall biosynthesis